MKLKRTAFSSFIFFFQGYIEVILSLFFLGNTSDLDVTMSSEGVSIYQLFFQGDIKVFHGRIKLSLSLFLSIDKLFFFFSVIFNSQGNMKVRRSYNSPVLFFQGNV